MKAADVEQEKHSFGLECITEMVNSCDVYTTHQRRQSKEPLHPHSAPERPWQKIGIDLFTFDQQEYLLLADYYSKFIEVEWLKSDTRSATVITHLKTQFARHGIPETVISDNGPQFKSREFQAFAKDWEFSHKTTSPYHAQSNGMAERGVQTVKLMLKKAKQDNGNSKNTLIKEPKHRNFRFGIMSEFGNRVYGIHPSLQDLLKIQDHMSFRRLTGRCTEETESF